MEREEKGQTSKGFFLIFHDFFLSILPKIPPKKPVRVQLAQMSRVHFEEDTPASTEGFNVTVSEEEMGISSQGKEDEEEVTGKVKGKQKDKRARNFLLTFHNFFLTESPPKKSVRVKPMQGSHDEHASTSAETSLCIGSPKSLEEDVEMSITEEVDMSTDEVVERGGKKKENKASGFSAFSNILAQRSSKDSTTEEIFCT